MCYVLVALLGSNSPAALAGHPNRRSPMRGNIQFLMSPLNFILELTEHPEHEHVFSELARALPASSPR
jgi:hypothetical protein